MLSRCCEDTYSACWGSSSNCYCHSDYDHWVRSSHDVATSISKFCELGYCGYSYLYRPAELILLPCCHSNPDLYPHLRPFFLHCLCYSWSICSLARIVVPFLTWFRSRQLSLLRGRGSYSPSTRRTIGLRPSHYYVERASDWLTWALCVSVGGASCCRGSDCPSWPCPSHTECLGLPAAWGWAIWILDALASHGPR